MTARDDAATEARFAATDAILEHLMSPSGSVCSCGHAYQRDRIGGHVPFAQIASHYAGVAVAAAAPILLADAKLIFETLTVTSKAREEQVERLIAEVARARVEGCSQHFDEWQKAVAALAAERAEVERLNRVIAAYEEDADVALVEKAEAVEAESQAADSVIAGKDAEIERLQAALALQAESVEAASAREDHIKAAERARIAAAIRRIGETPQIEGELVLPLHPLVLDYIEAAARFAETAPEPCLCAGHYMACDAPCTDFWLPDVPMSPDRGHAAAAPEEGS